MTILEGNTLIEKFMYPNEIIGKYRADTLVYHESWNKIMELQNSVSIDLQVFLYKMLVILLIENS